MVRGKEAKKIVVGNKEDVDVKEVLKYFLKVTMHGERVLVAKDSGNYLQLDCPT